MICPCAAFLNIYHVFFLNSVLDLISNKLFLQVSFMCRTDDPNVYAILVASALYFHILH